MLEEMEHILNKSLIEVGFVSRGKSFTHTDHESQLALISLSGRSSRPGKKCIVVCFRHTFLSDVNSELPVPFPLEPTSYPVKLAPNELNALSIDTWKYRSDLLQYPKGYLSSPEDAAQFVQDVTNNLLPWSESLTPKVLMDEIVCNGQDGYVERLWIDDYKKYVSV